MQSITEGLRKQQQEANMYTSNIIVTLDPGSSKRNFTGHDNRNGKHHAGPSSVVRFKGNAPPSGGSRPAWSPGIPTKQRRTEPGNRGPVIQLHDGPYHLKEWRFETRFPDKHTREGHRVDTSPSTRMKEGIMRSLTTATRTMYPDLDKQAHIKPPVHFNRVVFKQEKISDCSTVKVPVPAPQMSDIREDEAKQRIHNALTRLFHHNGEPVFVVFDLDFDNYLNDPWNAYSHGDRKPPNLAMFPRPRDKAKKGKEDYRGRYDVLILHRQYGAMIFDVRAIGDVFGVSDTLQSEASQLEAIRKKLRKSLEQLDKEESMIHYLCSDLLQGGRELQVLKGLMLPNLDKQTVRDALTQDRGLCQLFCRCLVKDDPQSRLLDQNQLLESALKQCIFRDALPPIGRSVELTDDNVSHFQNSWWRHLVEKAKGKTSHLEEIYEEVIARFCGPATSQYVNTSHNPKADVSTLHKAVVQTALCFSDSVLTEEQVSLLKDEPGPYVYITGPPATAKSVILQLKSEQWLRQGKTVFVLSLWEGSETASRVLYNKIKDSARPLDGQPRLHCLVSKELHFADVLNELVACVESQRHGTSTRPPGHTTRTPAAAPSTLASVEEDSGGSLNHDDHSERRLSSPQVPGWYHYAHSEGILKNQVQVYHVSSASSTLTSDDLEEDSEGSLNHDDHSERRLSSPQVPGWSYSTYSEGILKKQGQGYHASSAASGQDLNVYTRSNGWTHVSERNLQEIPEPASTKTPRGEERKRVQLVLVIDEAPWFLEYFLNRIQNHLRDKDVDLVIWAASTMPAWKPDRFHEIFLTRSLRCPPVVIREMTKGSAYSAFNRLSYSRLDAGGLAGMPSPTDGPPVKRIRHSQDHRGKGVWDCSECGSELATFLTHELKIGMKHHQGSGKSDQPAAALTFSDVLVSGYLPSLDQHLRSNNSRFLHGLAQGGVPVDVIPRSSDPQGPSPAEKLAAPSEKDRVQVAEPESVLGLERPVVVVVGTTDVRMTYPRYVDPWYDVMSRCTSQLVIVGDAVPSLEAMLRLVYIT